MLLAGHILNDGEVVLLILKPSRWSIFFSVLPFCALLSIATAVAALCCLENRSQHLIISAAGLLLAGRIMWATLVWMSRLYVMTDYRILRLAGVFSVELFDCPLRRVSQTRLTYSIRERLWFLGSIEIHPTYDHGDDLPQPAVWQTIRRPVEVHEQIRAAVNKAKSCGRG